MNKTTLLVLIPLLLVGGLWIKSLQQVVIVDNLPSPTPTITPSPTLLPALIPICKCESGLRQFNKDGTVLRGRVNKLDVGICQINTHYHGQQALAMNLDLETESDNITYANYLYSTQGSTPWDWSKSCWGPK